MTAAVCSGFYREVAQWCGDDVARALHAHYAGQYVTVPKRMTADHPLATRLGFDLAQRLARHFGGSGFEAPSHFLAGSALRRRVLELKSQGVRINDIAAEVRRNRRCVQTILKGAGASESERSDADEGERPQLEMF